MGQGGRGAICQGGIEEKTDDLFMTSVEQEGLGRMWHREKPLATGNFVR